MSDSSFTPVGNAASKIVIDLASRRQLYSNLKASVALESDRRAARDNAAKRGEIARMEAERGMALISKGIGLMQQNAGPDAAIKYLRDTLAAITGVAS